jgi:peptidyl-prolyl cis-trans isomerase C
MANTACARHILVKTQKQAEDILHRLNKGEDFGKLAKQFSSCPSAKKGGDLGEFRRGQMVKAFDDVVFKKKVLDIHGPVKTKFGFHIIQTIFRT